MFISFPENVLILAVVLYGGGAVAFVLYSDFATRCGVSIESGQRRYFSSFFAGSSTLSLLIPSLQTVGRAGSYAWLEPMRANTPAHDVIPHQFVAFPYSHFVLPPTLPCSRRIRLQE